MKQGYHLQTNRHALNALKVDVDLPKAELGIEYAENHSFYTIKFIVEKESAPCRDSRTRRIAN